MTYQEAIDHLHSLANPDISEHSQRFFKTGENEYGYGDKFLGIRVPIIRQAVRKFRTMTTPVAEELLKSEYHEIRLFALLILVHHFSKGNADEQEEVYRLYLRNTEYVNNWDLVDSSAHQIVGTYIESRERSILYELSTSASLWERRIAIMSTFHLIKLHQFDDTLKISRQLLNDNEDLIHKAVGWMLREVGKRDLAVEVAFLKNHYREMPRTMLRYAIEKFDEQERKKYLTGVI